MNFLKKLLPITLFASLALPTQAEGLNVDQLLDLVKQGQARDNKEFNARVKRFNTQKNQQESLLLNAKEDRTRLENLSAEKEAQFAENEEAITTAQNRLTERLGSLKEMFGVLQQVAGDTKGVFSGSVISAQLPDREAFLTDLIKLSGSSSTLPSIENLEQLWFEIQREMTLSGQVAKFNASVVLPNGETETNQVIRVGGFNLVADGNYLVWDLEAKKIIQLDQQPGSRYNGPAQNLENANGTEMNPFWIDPSRGQLLKIMGQTAGLTERIQQGGVVGYIILGLAVIGILLALWRMIALNAESGRIKKQMADEIPNSNNALGRVMAVYEKNKDTDTETLELHLGEAIISEVP